MAFRFHESVASQALRRHSWAPSVGDQPSQPQQVTRTRKCHHLSSKVSSPSPNSQRFVRERSWSPSSSHKQAYIDLPPLHHHLAPGILPLLAPWTARPRINQCCKFMSKLYEDHLLDSTKSTGNTQNLHFSALLFCLLPGYPSVQIESTTSSPQRRPFSAFISHLQRVSRCTVSVISASTCRSVGPSAWNLSLVQVLGGDHLGMFKFKGASGAS